MTDIPSGPAPGPGRDEARLQMRLRSGRTPVTRLSRKVIITLGLVLALAIAAALVFALQTRRQTAGAELYGIDNRATMDGLSNLPRDYTGMPKPVPKLGPSLPAISAARSSMRVQAVQHPWHPMPTSRRSPRSRRRRGSVACLPTQA